MVRIGIFSRNMSVAPFARRSRKPKSATPASTQWRRNIAAIPSRVYGLPSRAIIRSHFDERRRYRFLRDEQHAVNRVNLERDAQATQYAGLRHGALASGKFGEIGRGKYQRWFSAGKDDFDVQARAVE